MDISSSGKRQNGHSRRTLGNGRGSLGRIRTDFVEILKKGQEPIRGIIIYDLSLSLHPLPHHFPLSRLKRKSGLHFLHSSPHHSTRGLYPPPVIPAGIRSFLRNPAESGGIKFGRQFCQICHSGDNKFRRN